MMAGLSQRAFADYAKNAGLNISHVWINKLVKAGKLPVDESGKIPPEEGLTALQASQRVGFDNNRAHSDKQRAAAAQKKAGTAKPKATTKTPASTNTKSAPNKKTTAKSTATKLPPQVFFEDDDPAPLPSSSHAAIAEQYNRAKTAKETYLAKIKEVEYQELKGELLKKADVAADAAAVAERFRSILYALPPRLAGVCEGRSAREIETLIEDAINGAFLAFKESKFYDKGQ